MVTRSALQNAASIGKNILTTEAIVAEVPEKDGGGMPGHAGRYGRNDVRSFGFCKKKGPAVAGPFSFLWGGIF
jgi:hypothetical protein